MRRYLLYLILCICLFFVACSSIDEIDLFEESSMQQESSSIEREECNQDIVEDNNLTFENITEDSTEEVLNEESESASIEEDSSDDISMDTEMVSFWELMNASEELSEEDREVLQRFYPIFCEEKEFFLYFMGQELEGIVTLKEIGKLSYDEENWEFHYLEKFVFIDMTGDDKEELILFCRDIGGTYLIFYEENGSYHCSKHSTYDIREIYDTGLCVGGSASRTYFFNFVFNKQFVRNEVACRECEWDESGNVTLIHNINGQSVSEEEFDLWEETMVEETKWNYVDTSEWK